MARAVENIISNCEKKFLIKCLQEHTRLDGRAFDEFRELKIEFGSDWGSCYVALGQTQVLAQVSCEIQMPKTTRPSEGILYINVELNPIAAPHFEAGRQSDLGVQLNRLLEKCIKDSRAIDLESLCIKVREKVWALRVDVNVLNHEGNIIDCASIAALTALAHFRRPDVTCDGEEIIVHTYEQRDSIPTVIHHYPVCISFVIFSDGEIILADPTLLEEGVSETTLTLGLNAYKELCGLYLGGRACMTPHLILSTTNKAARRALKVIEKIKALVEADTQNRLENKDIGFHNSPLFTSNVSMARESLTQCLDRWMFRTSKPLKSEIPQKMETELQPAIVKPIGKQSAVLLPPETTTPNPWGNASDEEEEDDDEDLPPATAMTKEEADVVKDDGSSEEENIVVLHADKQTNKKRKKSKK